MTARETGIVMDILKAAYPNWNATRETAILWAQLFKDDDPNEVAAAVKAYIAQDIKGFAPAIGQIKQLIVKAKDDLPTEQEAWSLVRKAISNGLYGAYTEYDLLPPILQRVVGSPDQLTEWAMLTDGLDTVVASNVMRSYRALAERERFQSSLPSDVREALTGNNQRLLGE